MPLKKETWANDALAAVESLSCVSTVTAVGSEVEPAAVLAALITSVSSLTYKHGTGLQPQDHLMSGNTAYMLPKTYPEGTAWCVFGRASRRSGVTFSNQNCQNIHLPFWLIWHKMCFQNVFKIRKKVTWEESEGVCEAENMDVDTSAFCDHNFLVFGLKNTSCTFQSGQF